MKKILILMLTVIVLLTSTSFANQDDSNYTNLSDEYVQHVKQFMTKYNIDEKTIDKVLSKANKGKEFFLLALIVHGQIFKLPT